MKKIATGFGCVAVLVCVFYQSVEAAFGLPFYLIAGVFFACAVTAFFWNGIRGTVQKSYAFDQRVTDGGFLN